jgi:hypothetical protein
LPVSVELVRSLAFRKSIPASILVANKPKFCGTVVYRSRRSSILVAEKAEASGFNRLIQTIFLIICYTDNWAALFS